MWELLLAGMPFWSSAPIWETNQTVRPYYFSATCQDSQGNGSDFSNEVSWTNTAKLPYLKLAWSPPVCTNVVTNYIIWKGRASRSYTKTYSAGTNLNATVPLWDGPTNVVVHVASENATNLQWRHLDTAWALAMSTSLTLTNPQSDLLIRPMGRTAASPARATIWRTYY